MPKTFLLPLLLTAAGCAIAGCATPAGTDARTGTERPVPMAGATLEIRFEGIETPAGRIMLTLFDSEAAHDSGGDPVRAAAVEISDTTALAQFSGLAPGRYAVRAFHDIDGDGKMGTNPFGRPTEPFAFSNNAQPQGAPPRWEATNFAVQPGANRISITIK